MEIKGYVELVRVEERESASGPDYGSSPEALGVGSLVNILGGATYVIRKMEGTGASLLVEAIGSGNQSGIISRMSRDSLILHSRSLKKLRLSLEAEFDS